MQRYSGLRHPPLFAPAVANAYRGVIVEVPLQLRALPGAPSAADVHGALAAAYAGSPIVGVEALEDSAAMTQVRLEHVGAPDRLALFVFGIEARSAARRDGKEGVGTGWSGGPPFH